MLMPEDFALIALATTYIGFITIFTSIGFGSSIIHEQNATQEQLSSIYWLNYILGVSSFLGVALTVPFAADFYNEPELIPVVRIAAINALILPFYITHYKIKERDLEFKLLSIINFISAFAGAVAAVIGVLYGFGVYALVLQALAATVMKLILILWNSDWRPSRVVNLRAVRNMTWYSIKYKAAASILYLERNIDYLILGRIFTTKVLGYYAFAYNIMYTPVKRISYIFSDILFPSFSSLKDEPQKIIVGYFKSMQLVALVALPGMTLLAYNAEWIIPFVFGNQWIEAIPIIQILCFAGAIQAVSQFGSVIFSSIGKPEVALYVSSARTILVVLAIIIGSYFGILMVAYLLVIAKVLSFGVVLITVNHFIKYRLKDLLNYLKGPLITVVVLTTIQLLLIFSESNISAFIKLLLMSLTVLGLTVLFHNTVIRDLLAIIMKKSSKN